MRPAALIPLLVLCACSITGTQSVQTLQSLPSGAYQLEKAHGSLIARMKHMGLSNYTVRFTDFDATLDFDPKNPAASHVKAIINPLSVRAEHPTDTGWDKRIGEDLLEGAEFAQIVFDSKSIEVTGEFTGKITGDLTLMGVTEPVTLDVTYNGAAPGARALSGPRRRRLLRARHARALRFRPHALCLDRRGRGRDRHRGGVHTQELTADDYKVEDARQAVTGLRFSGIGGSQSRKSGRVGSVSALRHKIFSTRSHVLLRKLRVFAAFDGAHRRPMAKSLSPLFRRF